MRITGYKPMTEKENDYLIICGLLQKYKLEIPEFLDGLRGNVSPDGMVNLEVALLRYRPLLPFCVACDDSPSYTLVLSKLPENTVELLIETKCTTKC